MTSPPLSPPRSKRRRLDSPVPDSSSKRELKIRIFSWNINGIAPFVQPKITKFFHSQTNENTTPDVANASLRDFLLRHKWPTVLFLQEIKINPDDKATIHAVEHAVRKQSNESSEAFDYSAHFCLPSDKYNARGFGRKVYGVCSIVRKDFEEEFVEKIRPVDWDAEGRFLVIETKASRGLPKLGIVNIYAVNGTDNEYKDPATGNIIGTRHDRKLRVHSLLQAECRAMETVGFKVILAGDLNIARSAADGYPKLRTFPQQHCLNRADFEAKFLSDAESKDSSISDGSARRDDKAHEAAKGGLGMIDTFRYLHPSRRSYTYYPRLRTFGQSCDRVDMILVTQSLKDNLVEAGMFETPGERGPSDHVPLYAYLAFKQDPEVDAG